MGSQRGRLREQARGHKAREGASSVIPCAPTWTATRTPSPPHGHCRDAVRVSHNSSKDTSAGASVGRTPMPRVGVAKVRFVVCGWVKQPQTKIWKQASHL
ncbi:hypothetical protein O6H91_18G005600 [Diphasiastrum complanatum]|uniref:Uncharacterized protein n=1 Tax=Diphasiastrum complanatum TaxID=34168 RepID=A0ACC2AXP6_DIPCM|nr:hypothetical protein O6H91_18G005600 [Diphasiastrum complanatum]